LEGIGGIDDEDPVAMAEKGHGLFDAVSPSGCGGRGIGLGVNHGRADGQQAEYEQQLAHVWISYPA
jgi:hypothetical protein